MSRNCLCGEQFDKKKWDCIEIKRRVLDSRNIKSEVKPSSFTYLGVCPSCGTTKVIEDYCSI